MNALRNLSGIRVPTLCDVFLSKKVARFAVPELSAIIGIYLVGRLKMANIILSFIFYDFVNALCRSPVQPATRCLVLKVNKRLYYTKEDCTRQSSYTHYTPLVSRTKDTQKTQEKINKVKVERQGH